jgi:tetratricopeptide (TPR) repeat protein
MAYEGVIRACQARRLLPALCVFLVALASAGAAEAADTSGKLEAKAHFRAGQSHYNLNEFTDALVEFKEAYRLFPDPVFLYNLGQCERQLGHLEEALRFYRSFLREQPKAPNREEVSRRIEEMEAALKNRPAEGAAVAPPPAAPACSRRAGCARRAGRLRRAHAGRAPRATAARHASRDGAGRGERSDRSERERGTAGRGGQ